MKKLLCVPFIFAASFALAQDVYVDDSSTSIFSDDSRYESNSGTNYQYDLSDPSDTIDYSLDLDAQRRDQSSFDPNGQQDRNSGQYGGGIYRD